MLFAVGSDRFGGWEGRQSVAEDQKAHVLLATDVGRPQGVGLAAQSNGEQSKTRLKISTCVDGQRAPGALRCMSNSWGHANSIVKQKKNKNTLHDYGQKFPDLVNKLQGPETCTRINFKTFLKPKQLNEKKFENFLETETVKQNWDWKIGLFLLLYK